METVFLIQSFSANDENTVFDKENDEFFLEKGSIKTQ